MIRFMSIHYSSEIDAYVEAQYLEYSADSGIVTRVVEVFRDRRVGFADSRSGESTLGVVIPDQPIPRDALGQLPEGVKTMEISKSEFDDVWAKRDQS